MDNVTNLVDLLNEVSDCVENRDSDRLEELQWVVQQWMQMDNQRDSQLRLLQTVRDLVVDCNDLVFNCE